MAFYLANSSDERMKELLLSRPDILELADIEIAYEGYIKRHQQQITRLKDSEDKQIPNTFDFSRVASISKESREVLTKVQPRTLGQASRLPGVTPSDAAILINAIQRHSTFHVEQKAIMNDE